MKRLENRRGHRLRFPVLSYLIILAAAVIAMSGGMAARYIYQRSSVNPVAANQFYFTSDLLETPDENGNTKTYTLTPGTTEITFELRNYEDALRWSGTDIEYQYTVTQSGGTIPVAEDTGTISVKKGSSSTVPVKIANLATGTYDVTVTATKPFTKTLKGTFKIQNEKSGITAEVTDNSGSPYALLTVYVDNYDGGVTIQWPADVIPDTTQEAFESTQTWQLGNYNAGTLDVTVQAFSSYTYRFFKKNISENYSGGTEITANTK